MTHTHTKTITEGLGHKDCKISVMIEAPGTDLNQNEIERLLHPVIEQSNVGPNIELVRWKTNVSVAANKLAIFLSYYGRGSTLTEQHAELIEADSCNVVKHFLQVLPLFVRTSDERS